MIRKPSVLYLVVYKDSRNKIKSITVREGKLEVFKKRPYREIISIKRREVTDE